MMLKAIVLVVIGAISGTLALNCNVRLSQNAQSDLLRIDSGNSSYTLVQMSETAQWKAYVVNGPNNVMVVDQTGQTSSGFSEDCTAQLDQLLARPMRPSTKVTSNKYGRVSINSVDAQSRMKSTPRGTNFVVDRDGQMHSIIGALNVLNSPRGYTNLIGHRDFVIVADDQCRLSVEPMSQYATDLQQIMVSLSASGQSNSQPQYLVNPQPASYNQFNSYDQENIYEPPRPSGPRGRYGPRGRGRNYWQYGRRS